MTQNSALIESIFGKYSRSLNKKIETNLAVEYSRVSGKEQFDKNMSIINQKQAISEYAEKHNLQIVNSFGGTYESAKTDGRKEFQRMLDFIKKSKNKISTVLVYKMTRFSRTGGKAIAIADELREKYGIHVIAVSEPIDTSNANGVLFQDLQLIFGRWDNEQRKQVAMAGMKSKFEKGIWVVKPPQGYDIIRNNGERKIVVNADGKKIKKAFDWKLQGMKNEEIILKLKAVGVKMYKQQLHKIFTNPFYCGLISHGMLEGKVVEGIHEKMITTETFLAVNNIIQSSTKHGVPHKLENINIPLKVFIKCSDCKEPFTGYIVKKKNLYYYKCRTNGCKCNKSAHKMHKLFLADLAKYEVKESILDPIKLELENTFYELNKENIERSSDLNISLKDVDRNIDKLEEKYFIKEEMSKETYEKLKHKYQSEKQNIEKEMINASVTISNLKEMIEKATYLCKNLSKIWQEGDVSIKEKLQDLVFPEGIYFDKKIDAFRTSKLNSIISQISTISSELEETKKGQNDFFDHLSLSAEKEGFEPSEQFPVRMFSKHVLSATQAPLQLL